MSSNTTDNKAILNELTRLVGHSHLLTEPAKTARYRKGFRSGQGEALAVVFPGSLLELWRVLNAWYYHHAMVYVWRRRAGSWSAARSGSATHDPKP